MPDLETISYDEKCEIAPVCCGNPFLLALTPPARFCSNTVLLTIEDLIQRLKLTGEVRTLTVGDVDAIDAFMEEQHRSRPSSREWTCRGIIRIGPSNEDAFLLYSANPVGDQDNATSPSSSGAPGECLLLWVTRGASMTATSAATHQLLHPHRPQQ